MTNTYDTTSIWIFVIAVVFILIALSIGTIGKSKIRKREYDHESNSMLQGIIPPNTQPPIFTKPTQSKKTRHEEVIDSLDWMLENSIIDTKEYTNLMVKSLPYF